MSPETLLIAILGAIGFAAVGLIRFLPEYVRKQVDAKLDAQKAKQQQDSKEVEAEVNQSVAILEAIRSTAANTSSQNANIAALVQLFSEMKKGQDNIAGSIHGNSNAITATTETMGEMATQLESLVNEGSKPLQALIEDVKAIRLEVEKHPAQYADLIKRVERLQADLTAALNPHATIVKTNGAAVTAEADTPKT